MTQPKFNKIMAYARAYGSGPRSNPRMHRLIRPLFWEQRATESQRIRMERIAYMIHKTQEKKDGR